jgi:hypothetical protein
MVRAPFRRAEDLQVAFERLAASGVKAVISVPDLMLTNMRSQIADMAIAHHLAASFGSADACGGLKFRVRCFFQATRPIE